MLDLAVILCRCFLNIEYDCSMWISHIQCKFMDLFFLLVSVQIYGLYFVLCSRVISGSDDSGPVDLSGIHGT